MKMKKKNPTQICLYCSGKVKHIDREGVCTKCHKVDDEQSGYAECVFCGRHIDEETRCYVEGEGYSCDECVSYCNKCDEYHDSEYVNWCENCENTCSNTNECENCSSSYCDDCDEIQECTICGESLCKECMKEHMIECKKEAK